MPILPTAVKIKERLDAGFRYTADEKQFGREHWMSHASRVLSGKTWLDDCDGYALTAAQLAVEHYVVPPEDVCLVYCKTETGEGHLVCFISDEEDTWAIDNRQQAVWHMTALPYKWISGLRIGEKKWRQIVT